MGDLRKDEGIKGNPLRVKEAAGSRAYDYITE